MKKIVIFSATVFLVFGKISAQQDVQLTQFYDNKMFYNPADAGFSGDLLASLTSRFQWAGTRAIQNAQPQYYLLNVGQFFREQRSGVGVTVYNARQHVRNDLQIKASYNYHAQLGDDAYLAMGANLGFFSKGIREGEVVEGPVINQTYNMSDLGLGVKFYTPELQVGLAVQHIPGAVLGAKKSEQLHAHFYYYMMYTHVIDYDWKLLPHVFLKNAAGMSTNVNIGARVIYQNMFQAGLSWRRDAVSVIVGVINIQEAFSLGYSFDLRM
jgi:type IX secretion system PorP/SprF family membrane protein